MSDKQCAAGRMCLWYLMGPLLSLSDHGICRDVTFNLNYKKDLSKVFYPVSVFSHNSNNWKSSNSSPAVTYTVATV